MGPWPKGPLGPKNGVKFSFEANKSQNFVNFLTILAFFSKISKNKKFQNYKSIAIFETLPCTRTALLTVVSLAEHHWKKMMKILNIIIFLYFNFLFKFLKFKIQILD